MDWLALLSIAIVAVFVGVFAAIAGYLYGKEETRKKLLGTESGAAMVNLNQQITEIKSKFEAIEKSRQEREKNETKLAEEKDKSWKLLLDNTTKNEQNRLEQVQKLGDQFGQFQKLFTGTQNRGSSGEQLLKQHLHSLIKQGLVETDVNLGNNLKVEFAWKLNDGKYLPIDSKCPDVLDLVKLIQESNDSEVQKNNKNKIKKKVESSIDEVRKYQNLVKTTRYCIIAIPNEIYELVPELTSYAVSQNVLLTSHANVSVIAYLTAEKYNDDLEKGDARALEEVVKGLLAIMQKIQDKTDSIERGIKTIKNANEEITSEISKANKIR